MTFAPKRITERNPHTGEKLQTRVPNQTYLNNYDAIFRKPKLEFCDAAAFDLECQMTIAAFNGMRGMAIIPSDGDGVYGTANTCSNMDCFEEQPDWATHVYWYNK